MNVLFPANFGTGVGYAWNTIEEVLLQLGERLAASGHTVFIGYPALDGGEPAWAGRSPVRPCQVDFWAARRPAGLAGLLRFLRRHRIDLVYLTDRPTWSWLYPVLRAAGVRRILVHERTSGVRERRSGPLQQVKRAIHRNRLLAADGFIAVSDYVAQRMITVNGTPPERTVTVHNGIPVDRFEPAEPTALRDLLGIGPATAVIWASGRLQPYKGFHVLVDAAARVRARGRDDVAFALCGDGPQLPALREQARALGADHVHFLGRRDDIAQLLGGATIAAVPSLWEEAFGLTVVEAMAAGVPVVASRTGGIPELVEDGRSGLLVPPGDAEALADALLRLLADPAERGRLATHARQRARTHFSIERTVASLHRVLQAHMEPAPSRAARPHLVGRTRARSDRREPWTSS